ncbi:MAG: hypothetical protein R2711_04400 [Acidimicrobiales bacterium]
MADRTKVDPWFLDQMSLITEEQPSSSGSAPPAWTGPAGAGPSALGFGDAQLAHLWGMPETEVEQHLAEGWS